MTTTEEKTKENQEESISNPQTLQSTLLFQSTLPSQNIPNHTKEDRQYTFKIIKRRRPW